MGGMIACDICGERTEELVPVYVPNENHDGIKIWACRWCWLTEAKTCGHCERRWKKKYIRGGVCIECDSWEEIR